MVLKVLKIKQGINNITANVFSEHLRCEYLLTRALERIWKEDLFCSDNVITITLQSLFSHAFVPSGGEGRNKKVKASHAFS